MGNDLRGIGDALNDAQEPHVRTRVRNRLQDHDDVRRHHAGHFSQPFSGRSLHMPHSRVRPILFLVLAACSSVSEPVAPTALHSTSAALNSGDGVVLHVMGAGTVDLTGGAGGPGDASFQFVALRKADGTVLGHFRQSRMRGDLLVDFAGTVTCVTVDPAFPGRARIGGVVTENNSTDPAFLTANHEVGDDVWFRVQDGSVGGGAVDASTTYGFKPTLVNTSAEYCALPFDGLPWWNPASIFPLKSGTIVVAP